MTTTVVLDPFTRTNNASSVGSAPTGGTYVTAAGTAGILSNQAYFSAGVGAYAGVCINTGLADCTVEITISAMGSFQGLWLRSNGTIGTGFFCQNDSMWMPDGATLVGNFSASFSAGDRMRAVLAGTSIAIFRQVLAAGAWSLVFATTNSSFVSNTYHGWNIYGSSTAARFDDFLVTGDAYFPNVKIEIAFNAGYATDSASRTWTDVSQYVEAESQIQITHGRQDEFATAEANKLTVTLDNSDGRFTPGYASGAYYPNVKIGRPIRVTATVGGVDYVRFVGYIDEWPVDWPGSSNYATSTITAASRIARLGLDLPLRALIVEELLAQQPDNYWTLGEGEGATEGLDEFGDYPLKSPAGRTAPTFGGELSLREDSTTGATFSTTGTPFLTGEFSPAVDNDGHDMFIECFTFGPLDSTGYIFKLTGDREFSGPTGIYQLRVGIQATNAIKMHLDDGNGNEILSVWTATLDPTKPHHVHARLHANGVNTQITLIVSTFIDFDAGFQIEEWSTSVPTRGLGIFDSISVGFNTNETIGHVVAFNENFDSDEWSRRLFTGLVGIRSDDPFAGDRILLYAGYANVPASEIDVTDATSAEYSDVIDALDINGMLAIDAMRRVEATEGGVLFDSLDNILTYRGRAIRYNPMPAFTINAAQHQLESGVTPQLDRSTLINDVTATGNDSVTAHLEDDSSIAAYGVVRDSIELLYRNADSVYQAAAWRLALYKEPQTRVPNAGTDLIAMSTATQAQILSAEIGDVVSITNLPSQAPSSTLNQFIEGWTETIGFASYDFEFNVSPTTGYQVWVLQDATFGQLDTWPLAY